MELRLLGMAGTSVLVEILGGGMSMANQLPDLTGE